MNNPTRLIWSTWPPRCVWSGVFFFLEAWIWRDGHLSAIFSNPIETEWSWVVWHTSICFVLFRHVWLCFVSHMPCVSTLRNLWEPKLEPIWTGARLCSPTALWGNKEALWRNPPRFPKTPCYNHAENDVDLKKTTSPFCQQLKVNSKAYILLLLATFFKVYKFMRLQQIFSDDRQINKSISYFGFVDWLDVRITSEIVPKETIRAVVSRDSLPKAGA